MYTLNLNLNEVTSANQLVQKTEQFIRQHIRLADSFNIVLSGNSDPLDSPLIQYSAYANLTKLVSLLKQANKKFKLSINTAMPEFIANKELSTIFHLVPLHVNYYILNNSFKDDTQFLDIQTALEKLMKWDSANPMTTSVHFKINEAITHTRLIFIKKALKQNLIPISSVIDENFLNIKDFYTIKKVHEVLSKVSI